MNIKCNKVTWYSRIGAVVVFATAVLLGFYFWNEYQEIQVLQQSNTNILVVNVSDTTQPGSKYIEPTDEIIEKVKGKILRSEVATYANTHYIRSDDIDNDGTSELLVVQYFDVDLPPVLEIVRVLDIQGNYEQIIELDLGSVEDIKGNAIIGSRSDVPVPMIVYDLNNDGNKDIHLTWKTPSPRPMTMEVFLSLNWDQKRIELMEFLNGEGDPVPGVLSASRGGNTAGAWNYSVRVGNIDNDLDVEILELQESSDTNIYSGEDITFNAWNVEAYDWNGIVYAYSTEFSMSGKGNIPTEWLEYPAVDLLHNTGMIDFPDLTRPSDW